MRERPRNIKQEPSNGRNKRKRKYSREKVSAVCNTVQLPIILLPRDQIFKVSNTDKLSIQIRTSK